MRLETCHQLLSRAVPGSRWRLHALARTDSTNARLFEALGGGGELDRPWTVLCADEQDAGQGRRGRRWECGPGEGLLVSLRLDLDLERHALSLLGHWTALLLAKVLDARCTAAGLSARLLWKWPNDLILEDEGGAGKVAGILVRTQVQGSTARAILGIGLNVAQAAFPDGLRQPARSLAQAGLASTREALLADLLSEISRRGLPELGDRLLDELRTVDLLASRPVMVRSAGAPREAGRLLRRHVHLADGRLRLAWEGGEALLADGGLIIDELRREGLCCSLEP